jgi:hypothetical protein
MGEGTLVGVTEPPPPGKNAEKLINFNENLRRVEPYVFQIAFIGIKSQDPRFSRTLFYKMLVLLSTSKRERDF